MKTKFSNLVIGDVIRITVVKDAWGYIVPDKKKECMGNAYLIINIKREERHDHNSTFYEDSYIVKKLKEMKYDKDAESFELWSSESYDIFEYEYIGKMRKDFIWEQKP